MGRSTARCACGMPLGLRVRPNHAHAILKGTGVLLNRPITQRLVLPMPGAAFALPVYPCIFAYALVSSVPASTLLVVWRAVAKQERTSDVTSCHFLGR